MHDCLHVDSCASFALATHDTKKTRTAPRRSSEELCSLTCCTLDLLPQSCNETQQFYVPAATSCQGFLRLLCCILLPPMGGAVTLSRGLVGTGFGRVNTSFFCKKRNDSLRGQVFIVIVHILSQGIRSRGVHRSYTSMRRVVSADNCPQARNCSPSSCPPVPRQCRPARAGADPWPTNISSQAVV